MSGDTVSTIMLINMQLHNLLSNAVHYHTCISPSLTPLEGKFIGGMAMSEPSAVSDVQAHDAASCHLICCSGGCSVCDDGE
jgi:hypothetical protein